MAYAPDDMKTDRINKVEATTSGLMLGKEK